MRGGAAEESATEGDCWEVKLPSLVLNLCPGFGQVSPWQQKKVLAGKMLGSREAGSMRAAVDLRVRDHVTVTGWEPLLTGALL